MDFEVVVQNEVTEIIVVDDQAEIIVEGIQGPPGPAGDGRIGSYEVALTNLQAGDVLQFGGEKFINAPAPTLTDGGNF